MVVSLIHIIALVYWLKNKTVITHIRLVRLFFFQSKLYYCCPLTKIFFGEGVLSFQSLYTSLFFLDNGFMRMLQVYIVLRKIYPDLNWNSFISDRKIPVC